MQSGRVGGDIGNDFPPRLGLIQRTRGNRIVDQGCTLVVNLSGTNGIVADLRVAHVLVARHANKFTVGLQQSVRVLREKPVKGGCVGIVNRVTLVIWRVTKAIQHDGHHGAFHAGER